MNRLNNLYRKLKKCLRAESCKECIGQLKDISSLNAHESCIKSYLVQQQTPKNTLLKELPKPAVQHLFTCLELFPEVSRYRIWLMTLQEMGAG